MNFGTRLAAIATVAVPGLAVAHLALPAYAKGSRAMPCVDAAGPTDVSAGRRLAARQQCNGHKPSAGKAWTSWKLASAGHRTKCSNCHAESELPKMAQPGRAVQNGPGLCPVRAATALGAPASGRHTKLLFHAA